MRQEQSSVVAEFKRKVFHLLGLALPLSYRLSLLQQEQVIFITSLFLLGSLTVEIVRMRTQPLPMFELTMRRTLRRTEQTTMAAYVYWLAGALVTFFFFSRAIAATAIAASLLGDTSSAVAGTGIGRHSISWNKQKSVEGTLAGALTTLSVTLLFTDFSLILGVASAVSYVVLDVTRIPLDDNLTLPISLGIVLSTIEAFRL